MNKKIDFSEFFILAQKIVFANFKEVTYLVDKYDSNKEGYFSLIPFVEDLDNSREGGAKKPQGLEFI